MLRRPLSTHQREPDLVASPATRRRGAASTPTTPTTASTAPGTTSTAPAATSTPTTAVPATGRAGSTPGTTPAGGARLAAGLRPRLDAGASRQLIAARSASGATTPIIPARPPRRDIHRHRILLTPVAGGARSCPRAWPDAPRWYRVPSDARSHPSPTVAGKHPRASTRDGSAYPRLAGSRPDARDEHRSFRHRCDARLRRSSPSAGATHPPASGRAGSSYRSRAASRRAGPDAPRSGRPRRPAPLYSQPVSSGWARLLATASRSSVRRRGDEVSDSVNRLGGTYTVFTALPKV